MGRFVGSGTSAALPAFVALYPFFLQKGGELLTHAEGLKLEPVRASLQENSNSVPHCPLLAWFDKTGCKFSTLQGSVVMSG